MHKSLAIALTALCLTACQSTPSEQVNTLAVVAETPAASVQAGAHMAEALCSGCHAIEPGEISPNPQAPSFVAIANTSGLTQDTLSKWMRDSYNFPDKMDFEVPDEDVDDLAAYIITLRGDDYTPPTQ